MMKVMKFLAGWATGFLALTMLVSAIFAVMHLCAMFAFWGEGWMPKTPWFLWRFFVGMAFFLSIGAGFSALAETHGER